MDFSGRLCKPALGKQDSGCETRVVTATLLCALVLTGAQRVSSVRDINRITSTIRCDTVYN